MQLNTNRKKLIIILLSVGIVLSSGVATVYTLKYTQNKQVQQQADEAASRTANNATGLQKEQAADELFNASDLEEAKALYQEAATLYMKEGDTEGQERVKMQLTIIDHQLKTPLAAPQTIKASDAPIDHKLNAKLGEPAPVTN